MAETIKSIIEWHEQTFPDATLKGQIDKFDIEHEEWASSRHKDISELADMFIVACGIARFNAVEGMRYFRYVAESVIGSFTSREDFEQAIDEKMQTNRARTWNFENGVYQHREE